MAVFAINFQSFSGILAIWLYFSHLRALNSSLVPSTLFLTQHEVLLTLLENTGFTASYVPIMSYAHKLWYDRLYKHQRWLKYRCLGIYAHLYWKFIAKTAIDRHIHEISNQLCSTELMCLS